MPFLCVFLNGFRIDFERMLGPEMGSKRRVFFCTALKGDKRDSTAPVRADHVSGCPRNSKKRVVFYKCFSNRFAERFFPDLGVFCGACGMQNVIILAKFVSSVRD